MRLKKYVGVGYPGGPYAKLAEAETRARMNEPGLLFPAKAAVERSLADSAAFVDGIPALFDKYGIKGYEADVALLKTQLAAYDAFVRGDDPAQGTHRLPAAARGLRPQPAAVRRRHPAGAARRRWRTRPSTPSRRR